MSDLYTPAFYDRIRPGIQASADALVPILADWYAQNIPDRHTPLVIDVGCGEGWWAREWYERGYARSVTGVDGPWGGAAIERTRNSGFVEVDLERPEEAAFAPAYDVALCLEVAEHLADPGPLLDWLRTMAPVVFFSAAVPGQPGAGHVSCRWQDAWAGNFLRAGWSVSDQLRRRIWDDQRICWWYRQNLFVAYDHQALGLPSRVDVPLAAIHPDHWAVR